MTPRRCGGRIAAVLAPLALAFCLAPALALDCGRAKAKFDKAICADPVALTADSEMTRAFEALRAAADPRQRAESLKAQVRWVATRDGVCRDSQDAALAACLTDESRRRTLYLRAAPAAGPGAPGRLAPFFRIEKGGKGHTDIQIEAYEFIAPADDAQRAFNAAVDTLTRDIPQPDKDAPKDRWRYELGMTIAYASPRLLSAHAVTASDLGGAHPNVSSANVNIDVAAGREARFDGLLDGDGAQKIFAACAQQVEEQKQESEGADVAIPADVLKSLREAVVRATGDLRHWSFGADKARVDYDAEVVGSRSEGAFDCTIPYATLRPLAKAGFPLP